MAENRGTLVPLIVIALIFFFSGDAARSPAARLERQRTIKDAIVEERRWLSAIQNSTYHGLEDNSTALFNITGLEPDRGYAWPSLSKIKERAQEHLVYSLGSSGKESLQGRTGDASVPPGLYANATGFVDGKWIRSKLYESLHARALNLSLYTPVGPFGRFKPQPFERNITSHSGHVRVSFDERRPAYLDVETAANITKMSAKITLSDDQANEWKLKVHGVYFMELGQAILTTTSDKFAGIFALPQFTISPYTFDAAKVYLNQSLARTIERQKAGQLELMNPWNSQEDNAPEPTFPSPQCELVIYLQQLADVGSVSASQGQLLPMLEQELRFPTGAVIPPAPALRFSFLAFSPDCGYVLESQGPPDHVPQEGNHLVGLKVEVLQSSARRHLLLFMFTMSAQVALLIRQMREANTPSTRSRISFYTIAMLALGDGFATLSLLLISLLNVSLRLNLIGTGFVSFISVSFFGMRFLMDIWAAQAPERERRAREQAERERTRQQELQAMLDRVRAERLARVSQTNADEPFAQTEGTDRPTSLPLPVTAVRPTDTGASPVFMPSDQAGLEPIGPIPDGNTQPAIPTSRFAGFGALYTRFYLLLLVTLFLSLHATSFPAPIRRAYFTIIGILYLSFWLPQINRNVQRNCRHALNWEFVIGKSILRLIPFAYFYGYRDNILSAEIDYTSLAIFVLWLWIQVVVLGSQELLGPRWFIRKDWAPPAYDYHPILREDEEDGKMPIGFSEAQQQQQGSKTPTLERRPSATPAKDKERGKRIFDCAICMQELEVPIVPASFASSESSESAILGGLLIAQRNYMVTPCRHIFHSACLEGWMKYRLQCPICREALPSL